MTALISDVECQFLFLTAGEKNFAKLTSITSICAELNLPMCICYYRIIDYSCLNRIEADLTPQRPRLLLAGSFLEEQITVSALHCLDIGYEVFLLKDCVASKKPECLHVHDMRLVQSGVVPTTLSQLLYEWMSRENKSKRIAQITQLIELIDQQVFRLR